VKMKDWCKRCERARRVLVDRNTCYDCLDCLLQIFADTETEKPPHFKEKEVKR